MGHYKNPNYANDWYHRNKVRLKDKPGRKQAKKKANRKYYLKNREQLKAKAKQYIKENPVKVKERKRKYYYANREQFIAYRKHLRSTPEYKEYVKKYRLKNNVRINQLQKITSEKSIRKMVDNISDSYVVGQILCSPLNTLSREKLYNSKELIEIKRSQILLGRIKRKVNQFKK